MTWVVSLGGCLPSMAPATFPASAESTEPGTLLGPFEGRVTDAQSGRPVPGALVWVSWSFCKGKAMCLPVGNETWSAETDADGHYVTGELRHFPTVARLDRVTLVVYKRGYIGYRSDRYFEGALPRRDFAQTRNQVHLDRFGDTMSHPDHLAFLGGSGTLRAALRPEALQASLEAPGLTFESTPLDAATLLSIEELRQATGAKETFTTDRLEDRPRTARYDSVHFRSAGHGEESDAAFRVFLADSESEAEKTYEELLAELPNARPLDPVPAGIGARAATSHAGDDEHALLGLLILDRVDRAAVLFSCGSSLCATDGELETMAKKVVARLPHAGRAPLPVVVPVKAAPTKPAPVEEPAMKLREPGLHR